MESSLLINYNGEKVNITVKELLYQENPALQVFLPDGNQFILKDNDGTWVLLTEGEAEPELVRTVGDAINKASIAGQGPFAVDSVPAPPTQLF